MSRINKAVELLEQGQPIYYVRYADPDHQGFEAGREAAQTWADYIDYNMELTPYDIMRLRQFMLGLAAGGPTKSGHRTPAVVVTLPLDARNEQVILANAWVVRQVLATGVHGLMLCHAETPEAIRAFVECVRFPFFTPGVGDGLGEGRRGHSDEDTPAHVWGVSVIEYMRRADVWPLNPDGELIIALKFENKYALANVEATAKVPGICFAEWGPNDIAMSLGYDQPLRAPFPEPMTQARDRIRAALASAKIRFQEGSRADNVIDKINDGVMVFSCREGKETAEVGRRYTKRTMPW